jgi:hypothetical protein
MGVVLEIEVVNIVPGVVRHRFHEVCVLSWGEAWQEKDRLCKQHRSQGRDFTVRGLHENHCYL